MPDAAVIADTAARGLELFGIGIICLGVAASTVRALTRVARPNTDAYASYRRQLARSILLGLEVLVAADIIATVAVSPSLDNVATLAVIVLIRTFLSFSLEVEVEGRWPWRRSS